MATQPFTIYSSKTILVSNIVNANGKFVVDISPEFTNPDNEGCNSILLDIEFSNFLPDPDTNPPNWKIKATIESSNGAGLWRPVGSQFEPLSHPSQGPRQIIIVQPDIVNFDEGIPIDDWDGAAVVARRSRQQGILGNDFRVVLSVLENNYGNLNALQSFTVKMIGERYAV